MMRIIIAAALVSFAAPLSGQSLVIAGTTVRKDARRAEVLRDLSATGVKLLPTRDSSMVIVDGASRHGAFLWFDATGRLAGAQKSFSENDVPIAERVAMRMEAWKEFERLKGAYSCTTVMRAGEPFKEVRTSTLQVDCGDYRFEFTSLVSRMREGIYYSIAFNPPPAQR